MKSSEIHSTADLAQALGLSRWTVSRALNGHADISPATAARIRAEAIRLGFAPSLLGRSLRSGRTDLVGVCVPDLEDYFLTAKVSLLQRCLADSGLHVLLQIVESAEEEEAALRRFASMHCSACLTIASRVMGNLSGNTSPMPIVQVDPHYPRGGAIVRTDRKLAMRLAVRRLHHRGCQRLVTAGIDPGGAGYATERLEGIRTESLRLRWKSPPHFLTSMDPNDYETGRLAAEEFLTLRGRARTGVIASNDCVAFAMVQVLSSAGIRIPDSVAVIGYDDSGLARTARPPLTSINPQSEKLIRMASTLLLKSLNGEPLSGPLLLKPRLVIRASG